MCRPKRLSGIAGASVLQKGKSIACLGILFLVFQYNLAAEIPVSSVSSNASHHSRTLTDTERYKAKLYRGVAARWHLYVRNDPGEFKEAKVRIRFYVRADGVITNLELVEGKQFGNLAKISRRAIDDLSGQLEPFTEGMKEIFGAGFSDEISFRIEGSQEGGTYEDIINPGESRSERY